MQSLIFSFQEIDKTTLNLVGGKGASLGELYNLEGVNVPGGFCISTEAFKQVVGQLSLNVNMASSAAIREQIEAIPIPKEIADAVLQHIVEGKAYAIRSSATAEDLPTASFAGQQDTYLNVIGKEAILQHISKCWASLFTERAIIYRNQNGFDHSKVQLAVVVQEMVFPQAAGILFTADPVSGNRKVVSIDASFGLGEALVSGLVNADLYKVREGEIIDKRIAAKKIAIYAVPGGGTKEQSIAEDKQNQQALTDEQVLQLERIGRQIEAHFGHPQDIEWCLADDTIYIVQSRPITTLFPVPVVDDNEGHVYVSVGHQQMMTDAWKPLGISLRQLTASRPMFTAGGRMFVDIARDLAAPANRDMIINVLGKSDPLTRDALMTIMERGDLSNNATHVEPPQNYNTQIDYDPNIVSDLIQSSRASIAALQEKIQTKSGLELIDFILEDARQLHKILSNPQSFNVLVTGMNASYWVNDKVKEWLGEQNVADTLVQSVPNNVTSEMGLALLDVADLVRPYPQLIGFLQQTKDDKFLDQLDQFEGGQQLHEAFTDFLNKYGMRCAGEIDITRTRWSEKPIILVPVILSNIKNLEPNASKRRFEEGLQKALQKEQEILDRLKQLPGGEQKAEETKRMIHLIRSYSGYREYPKYDMVARYFIYKQALLKEVEQLPLRDKEDIYYLSFEEIREAVRTNTIDYQLINERKAEFKQFEKLTPPRVLTSDGEIVTGQYKRENLPANAMAGLAVSSGMIEGRARVILNMSAANIEEGDILVTTFTDPSWTPLFVSIAGLVTEVGGLMTHGAVIAREYGLPAVVGVQNATKLIQDGQRIRVHGTEGYVEIIGQ